MLLNLNLKTKQKTPWKKHGMNLKLRGKKQQEEQVLWKPCKSQPPG